MEQYLSTGAVFLIANGIVTQNGICKMVDLQRIGQIPVERRFNINNRRP
jgi:hypothetical protein